MKTWYIVVCDACGEATHCHVNGMTDVYLNHDNTDWPLEPPRGEEPYDETSARYQWYIQHYGCELRLVWRDDQLDALWEAGFERVANRPALWVRK